MAIFGASVPSKTPEEIVEKFKKGELVIVDVREEREIQAAKLDGSIFIRMQEIPHRIHMIPHDTEVGILCRSGNRSATVTKFLMDNGYTNVFNIAGGIKRWAAKIDPNLHPI